MQCNSWDHRISSHQQAQLMMPPLFFSMAFDRCSINDYLLTYLSNAAWLLLLQDTLPHIHQCGRNKRHDSPTIYIIKGVMFVCLFVCLSMFHMAGQMAGPIETKLDIRTHVHPGSVSVKVNVKVIHVREWQNYETPGMLRESDTWRMLLKLRPEDGGGDTWRTLTKLRPDDG